MVSQIPVVNGNEDLNSVIWTDKKRPIFGKPISFTRYTLYPDRISIGSGLLVFHQEEVRLYRVLDVNLRQTIFQRIFGVGTVTISSADSTTPKLNLIDVKNPKDVMRLISDSAEKERQSRGIGMMEGLGIWG